MNTVQKINARTRVKLFVVAAAAVFATAFAPSLPAAAASPAAPSQVPIAKIYIGPLTINHMRSWCWSTYGTFAVKKVGLNWFCNRPIGFDPVVNYTAACKKAYGNPTAFAGGPLLGLALRRCFKPLIFVAPG